jgi:hypothetical protein
MSRNLLIPELPQYVCCPFISERNVQLERPGFVSDKNYIRFASF